MVGLVSRLNGMSTGRVVAIWVVVAVLLGVAAVVFIQNRGGEEAGAETALEEGQQLVQVRRGDLVNQITSSGSIVFPNREQITFGTTGVIGEILVAEGDTVEAGQELARLDDETVALLERAVAQAELDLEQSREALEELQQPPGALDLTEAEAAIAKAELAEKQAIEALQELEDPFTLEEIDEAKADVVSATEALEESRDDLQDVIADNLDKTLAAQETLDTAKSAYQDVVTNYLGQTLTEADYLLTPASFFDAYGIDLMTLFSDVNLEIAVASLLPLYGGSMGEVDDPDTPWNEISVYRWITLYPGAIYGNCEGIITGPHDVCVLQDMDKAWDAVDAGLEALEAAQSNASKAESVAEKAIDAAEDALDRAEERLEEVYVSADSLEIQVKVHEIEVARAKLADARDHRLELDDPPDAETVRLREAQIKANEATLAATRARLEDVVISAPFAGEVSAVYMEAGRSIGANNVNSAVLEIVDTSVAEVDARLDEIDVLSVQVGAEATVSLDGLPNLGLPGVVREIAQTGENQQGVVTYPIQISVRTPPRLSLREGLSATASIVLQQELDVLLIPSTSIAGTFAQPTVLVSVDGEVTERAVTLGASDGFWTVVESGVNEGESLVSTSSGAGGQAFRGFGALGNLGGAAGFGGQRPAGAGQRLRQGAGR